MMTVAAWTGSAMNACCLFAYWGFNSWVPTFLSASADKGGMGFSNGVMSGLVFVNQIGMWFGYISFGYIADAIGRKRTYVLFVLAASILLPIYGNSREPMLLLFLGLWAAGFDAAAALSAL